MIRFDDVSKTYLRGTHPALKNLDIEFERGEFVFLVGASGSGKSTLMRLVLKETSPTSGTVYVAGKDLSRIPAWKVPALRREIGMVFQDFRLLPTKTAAQNIEFALQVIGTPRKQVRRLVPEMLEMVGLADKGRRLPHELSGGEQQRVAIARAYVNRPTILLADEPTGNLDPTTGEGILELLSEINERGTTVVMATHDQSAVDRMRRRVVELKGGIVIRDDESGLYDSGDPTSTISAHDEDAEPVARETVVVLDGAGAEDELVLIVDDEPATVAADADDLPADDDPARVPVDVEGPDVEGPDAEGPDADDPDDDEPTDAPATEEPPADVLDEELVDDTDSAPDLVDEAFAEDPLEEDRLERDVADSLLAREEEGR